MSFEVVYDVTIAKKNQVGKNIDYDFGIIRLKYLYYQMLIPFTELIIFDLNPVVVFNAWYLTSTKIMDIWHNPPLAMKKRIFNRASPKIQFHIFIQDVWMCLVSFFYIFTGVKNLFL